MKFYLQKVAKNLFIFSATRKRKRKNKEARAKMISMKPSPLFIEIFNSHTPKYGIYLLIIINISINKNV